MYLGGHYIIMSPRCVCMFCTVCYQKCQIELLEIGNIYMFMVASGQRKKAGRELLCLALL